MTSLKHNEISLRTDKGQEEHFGVRQLIQEKMEGLLQGQTVVLFIDEDNMDTDIASRHLKGS
ncbi:MAG: hypothetical protein WD425_12030 [Nitrospirales bacterium]